MNSKENMQSQSDSDLPVPSEIGKALKDHLKVPVVFKNQLLSWKTIPWTSIDMAEQYGSILADFRLVPKSFNGISWEGKAEFVEATVSQFISWQNDEITSASNPFNKYNKYEYWVYSSYNYMNKLFTENPAVLKAINWSAFGFPEITGNESTFWLGSTGAYTPCHMDSYGCNLHAQILGRKKWILFPPEDTSCLYPTRIPYEESSVFSSVNILNPDISAHPAFKECHPYVVIVEPGEVLFVPKKWWHFVSNLDDVTASINTWIKLDTDSESRLEESVAKSLMSCLITCCEPIGDSWLNPKEELMSPDDTLTCISSALKELQTHETDKTFKSHCQSKVNKIIQETDVHSEPSQISVSNILQSKYVQEVKPLPFFEWIKSENQLCISKPSLPQDVTLKKIIDCFVHPEVVSLICHLLQKEYC